MSPRQGAALALAAVLALAGCRASYAIKGADPNLSYLRPEKLIWVPPKKAFASRSDFMGMSIEIVGPRQPPPKPIKYPQPRIESVAGVAPADPLAPMVVPPGEREVRIVFDTETHRERWRMVQPFHANVIYRLVVTQGDVEKFEPRIWCGQHVARRGPVPAPAWTAAGCGKPLLLELVERTPLPAA